MGGASGRSGTARAALRGLARAARPASHGVGLPGRGLRGTPGRARAGHRIGAPGRLRAALGTLAAAARALILALLVALPAHAFEPDEVLDDPALETRARAISGNVRCVVCASEAIDTSQASIARDLRILIRERLVAGDSDAEVYAFLTERYGDYVLFRPPFKPSTYALWIAPFALLAVGAVALGVAMRRRPRATPEPLTPEEAAELEHLTRDAR